MQNLFTLAFILCFSFFFEPLCTILITGSSLSSPFVTAIAKNNYPIRFGYIDRIFQWHPVQRLASSLGVPGYSDEKIYNYLSLGFWKCGDSPSQAAQVWSKPIEYFGDDSIFGKTKAEIQANLKQRYTNGKVSLLVSAFGPQEKPTSLGYSWQDCANGLAAFVLQNSLDGADINWQDSESLLSGGGERWMINFHNQLRKLLPNHTIVHSPYAGYFSASKYPRGSYSSINAEINKTTNFYNVQYFNQNTSKYANYNEIFIQAAGEYQGTAVSELIRTGIDQKKIVVGKPVTPVDASSGWIDPAIVGQAVSRAYNQFGWYAGVSLWQYSSDVRGRGMTAVGGHLEELCKLNKNCK